MKHELEMKVHRAMYWVLMSLGMLIIVLASWPSVITPLTLCLMFWMTASRHDLAVLESKRKQAELELEWWEQHAADIK